MNIQSIILKNTTFFVFIFMLIIAALFVPEFYQQSNLANVARQVVPLGIVSFGMLMVILTSGIDLSVGSIMALCSVILGLYIGDLGIWSAMLLTIFTGVIIGSISGALVAAGNLAPFVATLAMMTIARGLALIFSKGQPLPIFDMNFMVFGTRSFFGVPYTFYLLLFLLVVVAIMFRYTALGRLIIATGSNETAVKLAGQPTALIKLTVYGLSGFMCALAAIVASARTGVGSPNMAIAFELDAIAAVVIGGAALSGGKGNVFNTFLGVLILGIISNVMNIKGIPGYHQQVVKGLIIIAAVLFEGLKSYFKKH